MYPNMNDSKSNPRNSYQQQQPKKNYFTRQIQDAIVQLRTKYNVTSVKPFLNCYQAYLTLAIPKGTINMLPLRIVFYQKYPSEKPQLFCVKPLSSPIINDLNGEIKYQEFYPWSQKSKIGDLITKVHAYFTNNGLSEDGYSIYMASYKKGLDDFSKEIARLSTYQVPPTKQPFTLASLPISQVPVFEFSFALKQKHYQEKLLNTCTSNAAIYNTLLQDYSESESKAQYISERFGKGRILKEMEAVMDNQGVQNVQGIENMLSEFQKKRKAYHRMEILKQKYLEN